MKYVRDHKNFFLYLPFVLLLCTVTSNSNTYFEHFR